MILDTNHDFASPPRTPRGMLTAEEPPGTLLSTLSDVADPTAAASDGLSVPADPSSLESWAGLEAQARRYAEAARAPATLRAYAADWRQFVGWCAAHGAEALPAAPQTLAAFLAGLTGRPATLRRKLAAIAVMHRAAGHDSPTEHGMVRATFAGICRERGTAPSPKAALLVDELRTVLASCGERRIDIRDRALMLIGFAGALRRSELVGLDVGDIRFEGEGVVLRLRRSKTNQRASSRRSPCFTALTRKPVRCERCKHGLLRAKVLTDHCFGPLIRSADLVLVG